LASTESARAWPIQLLDITNRICDNGRKVCLNRDYMQIIGFSPLSLTVLNILTLAAQPKNASLIGPMSTGRDALRLVRMASRA
jgi:hypothetical protein